MRELIRIEHAPQLQDTSGNAWQELTALIEGGKLSAEHIAEYEGWVLARSLGSSALVGCVGFERRGTNVYMESLVVERSMWRQGLGTLLTNELLENRVASGENLVALTLFWNNVFYERMGFERTDAKLIKTRDDVAGQVKHKFCTAWVKPKL